MSEFNVPDWRREPSPAAGELVFTILIFRRPFLSLEFYRDDFWETCLVCIFWSDDDCLIL